MLGPLWEYMVHSLEHNETRDQNLPNNESGSQDLLEDLNHREFSPASANRTEREKNPVLHIRQHLSSRRDEQGG